MRTTPNRNDALAALDKIFVGAHEFEAKATVRAFLESLPPPPFVLPPPGTEFVVRVGVVAMTFYRLKCGDVIEVTHTTPLAFQEKWFRDRGAEIVEVMP